MEARSTSVVVEVHAPICAAAAEILTPDSLRFVGYLCHKFEDRRRALLSARASRALEFDSGAVPHYDRSSSAYGGGGGGGGMSMREPHSHATDDPHWRCAPIPDDVRDRRVEITGPVDRKMVINGLNSGANVYMADFEGASLPRVRSRVRL
jgi:malate synthase